MGRSDEGSRNGAPALVAEEGDRRSAESAIIGARRNDRELPQRWSARRKGQVVLRMLRGEALDALSRELAVPIYRLEEWRQKALSGVEAALKRREGDPVQADLDEALKRIGELSMENELLYDKVARLEGGRPLARRRSRR